MSSERNTRISAILSILISLCNLGEQIGIYFAENALGLNDEAQRKFFYILFGITGINLFKAFCRREKWEIAVSLLLEIVQLICYLAVLGTTTTIVVVAVIFFVFEAVFHIVYIVLNQKDDSDDNNDKVGRSEMICTFFYELFSYVLLNFASFLTLFLSSDSRFRQPVFEVPLILSLFFASASMEMLKIFKPMIKLIKFKYDIESKDGKESKNGKESKDGNQSTSELHIFAQLLTQKSSIERSWTGLNFFIGSVFNTLVLSILTIVLASLEIKENGTTMPSYDRGLYIYLLISYSSLLLLSPLCIILGALFAFIYGIIDKLFSLIIEHETKS